MKTSASLCSLFGLCFTLAAQAEVRLPAVISDHMVVQAGKPVAIWGWADAGEEVTVEFAGQKKTVKADAKGDWQVKLEALSPSKEGRELRVHSKVVKDVLVGEVWLASGQSNMAMQIKGELHGSVDDADAVVAAAKHPEIRVFVHDAPFAIYELPVPEGAAAKDRPGKWQVCSPETVGPFSAMGYFFARDLLAEIQQPVGILTSAVGGTPIEGWTSLSAQQKVPELKPLLEDWGKRLDGFVPEAEQKKFLEKKAVWLKERAAAIKAKQPVAKAPLPFKNLQVMKPGGLYAGMIEPLAPYTMRGVIWYQGERNAAGPFSPLYGQQMQLLISDWRARWGDEFHFAWVQLPAVKGVQKLPSEPKGWGVAVRDGQRRALSVPHTSMAITMDLKGELNGHPTNKVDYAKRLSTVVLHDVYQKAIAQPTGPLFKSSTAGNGKMALSFDHAEGLKAKEGNLEGFAIAGVDGKFVWANAKVEGEKVIVWHGKITEPKTVHYAFAGNPKGNLVNGAGIPASPFSTE
ncbi:sialate O-acetylesterase [Brevifollis gellanilyticus]|uniref:9-O-acetylesterase n=1 Tax=Brevifollis gellanilyticus TaxID=748831 RepID=A0A512MCM3_9BACT|nr:sialate O-acetylesterase [Brevifollis gellanilyticus]GEP44493.1 9-O-acetylesterase [Brevifollis gellanilyticus]